MIILTVSDGASLLHVLCRKPDPLIDGQGFQHRRYRRRGRVASGDSAGTSCIELMATDSATHVVAALAFEHDADLVLSREMLTRLAPMSFTTCSAAALVGDFLKEG